MGALPSLLKCRGPCLLVPGFGIQTIPCQRGETDAQSHAAEQASASADLGPELLPSFTRFAWRLTWHGKRACVVQIFQRPPLQPNCRFGSLVLCRGVDSQARIAVEESGHAVALCLDFCQLVGRQRNLPRANQYDQSRGPKCRGLATSGAPHVPGSPAHRGLEVRGSQQPLNPVTGTVPAQIRRSRYRGKP